MYNKISAEYIEETTTKKFIDPKKLSEIDDRINKAVKAVMNVSPDVNGNVDISDSIKRIVDNKNAIIKPVHSDSNLLQYPFGLSTMTAGKDFGYPNTGIIITSRVEGSEGFQLFTSSDSFDTYVRSYDSALKKWQGWVMLSDKFGNKKSDEINSNSSETLATSKAVSDVNKKAIEALNKAEEAFLSGIDIKRKVIGAINSKGQGKPLPEDSSWEEIIEKSREKGSNIEISNERCNQYRSDFNGWTGSNMSRYGVRAGFDNMKHTLAVIVQNTKIVNSMSDYLLVTVVLGHSITPFNNAMAISMRIRGNSTSMSTEIMKEGKGLSEGHIPIHTSFSLASGGEYIDKEFFTVVKVSK